MLITPVLGSMITPGVPQIAWPIAPTMAYQMNARIAPMTNSTSIASSSGPRYFWNCAQP